jgi:squalene-associated FAD-dependent desaturase
VELAARGARVTVFEAAPEIGGRARSLNWSVKSPDGCFHEVQIDNGQHLLVGAYQETLALLERLGGFESQLFKRMPFTLNSDRGLRFNASGASAPWHLMQGLLRAQGLSWADRISVARLGLTMKLRGWKTAPGLTVAQLLSSTQQTEAAQRRVWNPLCLAALNTPPTKACAASFAAVLRDTLGSDDARASDMLVPNVALGETLPKLAAQFLMSHHGIIRRRHLVRSIQSGPTVDHEPFDGVVVALAAHSARRLMGPRIPELPTESIQTLWLMFAPGIFEPHCLTLMEDGPGEWLFTRAEANGATLASVVISAAARATDRAGLIQSCLSQLERVLARQGRPTRLDGERVLGAKLIHEAAATFSCRPGLKRPDVNVLSQEWPSVMIAGDWTASEYPATLESAVRSGLKAARQLAQAL